MKIYGLFTLIICDDIICVCEIYVLILSRFFFFFSTTTFIYECLHPKRKGGNEGRIDMNK
ncbi:hypothetical protein PFFCH_05126 [Plasmodium falciparum FCH/4]|uniref:Uncharacterized protein n=1 Tax=Plasmodium falciparum FCH/4 TaxID=1036724 RepID=A0A024VFN7_PLAFA|nr:hypothetical protein PFFCH_05126 [Plasmodium falciparum FCH/4]